MNAIAFGKGAAFGVDLWTKAEVKITNEPQIIRGEIASDPAEKPFLIEKTAARVFKHFKKWEFVEPMVILFSDAADKIS